VVRITLKKIIKAFVPYGILVLIRYCKHLVEVSTKGSDRVSEVIEPRGGRSPLNVSYPPPPNTIPENMVDQYTQNGKLKVLYYFFDDRVLDENRAHNTNEIYRKVFRRLDEGQFRYYESEGNALLLALGKYPVQGKSIIIWGLAGCNCEAVSVWSGADKVYVVDYNKPICDNDKIEVMNHDEITQKGIRADFAISYSSFEHDGLGRYGDPLSPNGDLRAMEEAHKFLKNDGVLFLGVPLGQDCIVWNAHRIYGKHRLPLLLKGWQLLDVFDVNEKTTAEYPFDLEAGKYIQNVLVLKRIEQDYPPDECFTVKSPQNKTGNVFEKINNIIYEYKHA
jgi:hypothetical protein